MIDEQIQPLTVKKFLEEDKYRIPIYQRNYDWGEKESLQLIEDIADYALLKKNKKYYIGSVVVFVRHDNGEDYYETIDGQQRLTTLTIIMMVLRSLDETKGLMTWFFRTNLSYDHRDEADEALRLLLDGRISERVSAIGIGYVYDIIRKKIRGLLKDKRLQICDFVEYLLNNVILMRIPVPGDTELNHYFEIMNSRGEQLEKHEVLKASLMDSLEKDRMTLLLFNDIWEACSDMSTYVQMKMKPKMRGLVFTQNWDKLQFCDFNKLLLKYRQLEDEVDDNEEDEYVCRSLSELFKDAENNVRYELPDSDKVSDGGNERFDSVINFQNFLLQTLKVMYHSDPEYNKDVDADIKLDDKRLIDIFQGVLDSCKDKCAFVKRYIMALLKMRTLFDSYVIKRESYNNKERWSLKRLKKYEKCTVNYVGTFSCDDNDDDLSKDIRMLEAMFHVSAPTQIYKHWLNAVLFMLFPGEENITPEGMRSRLFELACTYMLDRYLTESKTDFEDIIYRNGFKAQNDTICWKLIDKGCSVENFIFNFYDYLTWKTDTRKYQNFEFTYRTSVEHFYPQTPMEGYENIKCKGLDDFGNLCLISRGMNSKFNNNMPTAKVDNFGNDEVVHELSLKLNEMMEIVKSNGRKWATEEIADFEKSSRNRLITGIKRGCNLDVKETH